ncbi:hypothetical protein PMAYCL1PPCAC_01849, partial [Pristionchus mayeri]
VVIALFVLPSLIAAESLPEGFFGRFRLGNSDNFDEYLTAKGYGWLTRKIVAFASVDKVFTKTGPNTFDFDNLTTKKNLHYKNVVLGKEFIGEGLDSTKHRITFHMRGNRLNEKHVPITSDAKQKEDEYVFELNSSGMVQILETKGIVARRYFKR